MNDVKIKKRSTKNKPFMNRYNWQGLKFPSEKDDWKKFEENNLTIALNVLYTKKEKIYSGYVPKHNSNLENQVILLIIPNGEQWDDLAVKKLSALLRGIISKHHGVFYWLN